MSSTEHKCNADLDHRCDAGRDEDGEPCPCLWCQSYEASSLADYHRAPPARREYAREMLDAGRGHLLTDEERAWVER